ncbi:hypothetical protein ACE15N_18285 [Xanthomonas campestris pv. passiflorae]|uniref:hypothetical protein n=1 Tax=Xanthomonas campestris TaxID=339 RepID=UPI0024254197|nr:hypothetical protein [Xanthomonas campestris]MBV6813139.1 hypothetical protein [Xanthomonas campestris pv. passiflorae]
MDEKFFDGLDRHVWLLGLVRGWVAAVRHVDGDALLSSRCTSAKKRADGSRTTPFEIPYAPLARKKAPRACRLMFLKYTDVFFDLQAAPRGRYASPASVSGIGGNGDPGAMATCAVVQAALAAWAMMESSIGVPVTAIASAWMRRRLRIAADVASIHVDAVQR